MQTFLCCRAYICYYLRKCKMRFKNKLPLCLSRELLFKFTACHVPKLKLISLCFFITNCFSSFLSLFHFVASIFQWNFLTFLFEFVQLPGPPSKLISRPSLHALHFNVNHIPLQRPKGRYKYCYSLENIEEYYLFSFKKIFSLHNINSNLVSVSFVLYLVRLCNKLLITWIIFLLEHT